MEKYKLNPKNTETIPIAARNPATLRVLPFQIVPVADKEETKIQDEKETSDYRVYTDSSAHDRRVGAAATIWEKKRKIQTLSYYLGTADEHTIFKAELVGLILGMQLIRSHTCKNSSITIEIDNQATLKAMKTKLHKSDHYLVAESINFATTLKRRLGSKTSLKLKWTAGHVGIEGNEDTDKEAKKAADGYSSSPETLPPILRRRMKANKSVINQFHNDKHKKDWKMEWSKSPRYKKTKHIDPTLPLKKFLKLISHLKLSRSAASKIFQLRSGHVPLNTYLFKIKHAASPSCPNCGHPKETSQHFVMECPAYDKERRKLFKERNPACGG